MRPYALTYPQLMNQAITAGWSPPELERLRQCHSFAAAWTQGMFRASLSPFLCHFVQTSSIVLAEGEPSDLVCAALLHALRMIDRFPGQTSRPTRAVLRELLTPAAATLVDRYPDLRWGCEMIEQYRRELPTASAERRQLLLLRIANELEDQLDAAFAYVAGPLEPHLRRGAAAAALARALGRGTLADELDEALAAVSPRPPALVSTRREGYRTASHPPGATSALSAWPRRIAHRAALAWRRWRS